jgi:hypothetical protein
MQELPKGKDFESIFCRFDGANPDLPSDPEQVTPDVTIMTRRSTGPNRPDEQGRPKPVLQC